jgi:hypothetical protein
MLRRKRPILHRGRQIRLISRGKRRKWRPKDYHRYVEKYSDFTFQWLDLDSIRPHERTDPMEALSIAAELYRGEPLKNPVVTSEKMKDETGIEFEIAVDGHHRLDALKMIRNFLKARYGIEMKMAPAFATADYGKVPIGAWRAVVKTKLTQDFIASIPDALRKQKLTVERVTSFEELRNRVNDEEGAALVVPKGKISIENYLVHGVDREGLMRAIEEIAGGHLEFEYKGPWKETLERTREFRSIAIGSWPYTPAKVKVVVSGGKILPEKSTRHLIENMKGRELTLGDILYYSLTGKEPPRKGPTMQDAAWIAEMEDLFEHLPYEHAPAKRKNNILPRVL